MESKQYPYLEHNLLKIAEQVKFLNWNLGKLVALQLGDTATIDKIKKAEKEEKKVE
jgi:hypothetical protein